MPIVKSALDLPIGYTYGWPGDDEDEDTSGLCRYESDEPGTLLCVLPEGHEGEHDTPSYTL